MPLKGAKDLGNNLRRFLWGLVTWEQGTKGNPVNCLPTWPKEKWGPITRYSIGNQPPFAIKAQKEEKGLPKKGERNLKERRSELNSFVSPNWRRTPYPNVEERTLG